MKSRFVLDKTAKSALYALYLYAFNKPNSADRKKFWSTRFDHGIPYGIFDEHELVSGLFSMPFEVNFHGQHFLMNGITDVMSVPEYSGKGAAGTLMQAALQDMYANAVVLSYLAPFSFSYYRKFGYEQVFDHRLYHLAGDKLPRVKPAAKGRVIRTSLTKAIPLIKKTYSASSLSQKGGLLRQAWWWQYLTEKHPDWQVAYYQDEQQAITGYLIYTRTADQFSVHEFVHLTPASYQSLASFVFKHGAGYQTYTFEDADPSYQGDLLADPYALQVTTQPYMMGRIVNLQSFLEKYPFQQVNFEPISFNLKDETIKQNQGAWTISATAGKVGIEHDSESQANVPTFTIQQFTKAAFGYRSFASQQHFGQLDADPEQLTVLDNLFVNQKPILADYF
ncbi:GNAT family N-acetyltransferase [Pediococcus cellicola]|uniref:Putative acetyltransferase (Putative) n=1 Tax=Pediococcus cellicola TaxID=319652 RepID=A0A0R2IKM7_9LACO|nr:GNAT family N-acetyltransferase [Pediococcus cellicola]KRN65584.1 putative acetyltransferase (putative) [Pediococcus cellicola]GEL15625.1 GNAT family acetyltransferase [Pediococcus cellicola]